jgi:hypothetical protein
MLSLSSRSTRTGIGTRFDLTVPRPASAVRNAFHDFESRLDLCDGYAVALMTFASLIALRSVPEKKECSVLMNILASIWRGFPLLTPVPTWLHTKAFPARAHSPTWGFLPWSKGQYHICASEENIPDSFGTD